MSNSNAPVAVLGTSRFAQVVTGMLLRTGRRVRAWSRSPQSRVAFKSMLPNADVVDAADIAIDGAGIIVFCVPGPAVRDVAEKIGAATRGDQIVLHASRGVGPGFLLPHQAIRNETSIMKICALGGPLYVDDAMEGRPLHAVCASRYDGAIAAIRALTQGTPVRMQATNDIVGVEIAGALAQVSQLAAGMAEGLGMSVTDQVIMRAHALEDAARLGVALGAERTTFTGLVALAEMIPRPVSSSRKHHALGARLSKEAGTSPLSDELLAYEGVHTAHEACLIAEQHGVKLPLVKTVDAIVKGDVGDVRDAMEKLLRIDLEGIRL